MAINYSYNYAQVARDSGFKLRQYKEGLLDWRLIGCLEVERIMRDQSLEQIDGVLSHLSEAPLGSMLDTNILDSGIAKYFVLSQFSIQYLLFCRKFLDETVKELRESLVESQMEVGRLRKSVDEANNEVLQLNKKITQMEAIHEVVYPCHMCTKNFVSNEALNLHIGRKHGSRVTERRMETPPCSSVVQHEKDNDRNLINTIKLELEIKQLKERLNTAEKDIRDRSEANSRRVSSPASAEKLMTKDIAIQSNLMEEKERDDTATCSEMGEEPQKAFWRERQEDMMKLQMKIKDFERWQEVQKQRSDQSIGEINQKLENIALTLEATKRERTGELISEQQLQPLNAISSSVEQLEKMLTDKFTEIGKTSAKKLEEAVNHMEQNYNEKLNELEQEIKMRIESDARSRAANMLEKATNVSGLEQELEEKRFEPVIRNKLKEKRQDKTHEIPDIKKGIKIKSPVESRKNPKVSVSSESNRTFVKTEGLHSAGSLKGADKIPQMLEKVEDSTDISESLSEEETETSEQSDEEEGESKQPKAEAVEQMRAGEQRNLTTLKNIKEQGTNIGIDTVERQKRHHFSRKDAKKMSSQRLSSIGFDYNTKGISRASLSKASAELLKHRSNKHPDFDATRNKMRKFVEKLCSTKLPENAKALLRRTQPLRPTEGQRHPATTQDQSLDSELDIEEMQIFSTPVSNKEPKSDTATFKQHLEHMFNSPKRYSESTAAGTELQKAPVPIPRKRVMFNTFTEVAETDASETTGVKNF